MKRLLTVLLTLGTMLTAHAGTIRDVLVQGKVCYAAGDGGLMLRSDDAGKTWQRLSCPTTASFNAIVADDTSVYFIGGQGVAGLPSRGGQGVILKTADGGKTFEPIVSAASLPCLYGGFIKGKVAAVFGEGSGRCPSGLWRTGDGGRSWVSDKLQWSGFLLGGQWKAPNAACLVGSDDSLVEIREVGGPILRSPALSRMRPLRAVGILDDGTVFAAGDNGAMFRTKLGQKEALPVLPDLPRGAGLLADLRDMAVTPGGVYVVGGLWGGLLHSPDGGKKWQTLQGPRGGEVCAIAAGDGFLLTAGSAGRIWRSDDDAKTWTLVAGKDKTDILFIASCNDISILPAVVAHVLAGDEVAVVLATAPGGKLVPPEQNLQLALAQAGVGSVTVLNDFATVCAPTDKTTTDNQILQAWSDALDINAGPEMVHQLAAAIRLYKPAVLCVGPNERGFKGFIAENRLVGRLALQGAELAADAKAAGDLDKLGLAPWAPTRIFRGVEANESTALPGEKLAIPDRKTSHAIFDSSIFWQGQTASIETLANRIAWTMRPADLPRPPRYTAYISSDPRYRPLFTQGITQAAYQPREMTALERDLSGAISVQFVQAARGLTTAVGMLSQNVVEANDNQDLAVLAADRLLLVWQGLLQQGRLVESEEARREFLRVGANHPLYPRMVVLDLACLYSLEWKSQLELHSPPQKVGLDQAALAIRRVQALDAWADQPDVRIALARAQFRSGRGSDSEETLKALAAAPFDPIWKDCAQLDLATTAAESARSDKRRTSATCVTGKGSIDGFADEPFWAKAGNAPLLEADGKRPAADWKAQVRVIRTQANFLVLAVTLPQVEDRQWQIELAFDVDRDTQLLAVLNVDSDENKTLTLQSRLGAPANLDAKAIRVKCNTADNQCTLEIAVPLALVGIAPQSPSLCGFGLRATARDRNTLHTLYYQPQADNLILGERLGLLEMLPVSNKAAR